MLNFKDFVNGSQPNGSQPLNEMFDKPYEFVRKQRPGTEYVIYRFKTSDSRSGYIEFEERKLGEWNLEFKVDEKVNKTGEGDAPRILATVVAAMEDFLVYIGKEYIFQLNFIAVRDDNPNNLESRIDLYRAMLKRFSKKHVYQYEENDHGHYVSFILTMS